MCVTFRQSHFSSAERASPWCVCFFSLFVQYFSDRRSVSGALWNKIVFVFSFPAKVQCSEFSFFFSSFFLSFKFSGCLDIRGEDYVAIRARIDRVVYTYHINNTNTRNQAQVCACSETEKKTRKRQTHTH